MLNDYDQLSGQYQKSDAKPDKLYSTLPTVIKLAGDLSDKVVLDLGCGTGFFARELAKRAKLVYGFDNSKEQISSALRDPVKNIEFSVKDIFVDPLPLADVVVAPYVFTYAKSIDVLLDAFENIYKILNEGGRAIIVLDDPVGLDLSRFGAMKRLDKMEDEAKIHITLFDRGKEICRLNSVYYTRETVRQLLEEVGFTKIEWHRPIISKEGMAKFGIKFWEGYTENPELMYIVALK